MLGAIKNYSGSLSSTTEIDLATISGKGYLRNISVYLDSDSVNECRDVEIVFYIDGEGTASTRVKHGYLFGWNLTDKEFSGNDVACVLYDGTNFKFMGTRKIRVPFNTSAKLSLKSVGHSAGVTYNIVLEYITE